MKGPIKMQDNYFKFLQTSFKDVYSLTLRKFLYPWLFPQLAATMDNANGLKLLVELVPTDLKYSITTLYTRGMTCLVFKTDHFQVGSTAYSIFNFAMSWGEGYSSIMWFVV